MSVPATHRPTPCSAQEVPQGHYHQTPGFTDYCHGVFPHSGLSGWCLTEDFEAFLGGAQGSQPVGSRCAAVGRDGPEESAPGQLEHQSSSSTDEPMDELSDLCFRDLGDFNLSDLDISAAMIDYLLG